MLATHFTLSADSVPTPDDLLIKQRAQNRYSNYVNYSGTNTGRNDSWYDNMDKSDDMDKRRSCENCGPYPILMNVDGININTKAHVTDASDQVGQIYIGREELNVRRIGHNAMLEQDAVHIGCETDLAAHVLDVQDEQFFVKGLLDTGAVVTVMPVSTWTDMGFDRLNLIPTNIRLAAANQGAIYVTGRTPIISLQLGGRHIPITFHIPIRQWQSIRG